MKFRKLLWPLAISIRTIIFSILPGTVVAQESPQEIMDRVDRVLRGNSSYGIATMHVTTEHWERSLTMEVWSLDTNYSLIRVLKPRREEGTATLKVERDIWNYLPKVDRTIKMPTSMMSSSWMGSHFTNDDLVKDSRLVEDFEVEVSFNGVRDSFPVWEFTLVPKPEAAIVWGSIKYQVRKKDYMPQWARYYDEDGVLSRTMVFSEFKELGGRLVPSVMSLQPAEKPNESTRLIYEHLKFDVDLEQSFFSLQALKSQR